MVSDVHGASQALARAGQGSDLFVCLGDLILFLDYDDPTRGIYTDLFGPEHTRAYIEARTENRFDEARELSTAAWRDRGVFDHADRWSALEVMIRKQYQELFDAMPTPALLTYGNVDVPDLWPEFLKEGHQVVDGATISVNGIRMGFVGGGLASPMRTPYELTEEQYAEKIQALGPVDVLFTHIPPAVPQLTYDIVARRFETGSHAILEYLKEFAPALHLFGHVHQPLRARARIGKTECMNVGHFHGNELPFVIDL